MSSSNRTISSACFLGLRQLDRSVETAFVPIERPAAARYPPTTDRDCRCALDFYKEVICPRHLNSFPQFGIEAPGFLERSPQSFVDFKK
jgi:hypothetical protein